MSDGWPKPRLVAVSGDQHDMPPKWDGVVVEWSEWRPKPFTTAEFHGPPDLCDCGSGPRRQVTCHGYVRVVDEVSHRTGRFAPRRVIRFLATRCVDCHADTVVDEQTGHFWALDPTDYSDVGSTA